MFDPEPYIHIYMTYCISIFMWVRYFMLMFCKIYMILVFTIHDLDFSCHVR